MQGEYPDPVAVSGQEESSFTQCKRFTNQVWNCSFSHSWPQVFYIIMHHWKEEQIWRRWKMWIAIPWGSLSSCPIVLDDDGTCWPAIEDQDHDQHLLMENSTVSVSCNPVSCTCTIQRLWPSTIILVRLQASLLCQELLTVYHYHYVVHRTPESLLLRSFTILPPFQHTKLSHSCHHTMLQRRQLIKLELPLGYHWAFLPFLQLQYAQCTVHSFLSWGCCCKLSSNCHHHC